MKRFRPLTVPTLALLLAACAGQGSQVASPPDLTVPSPPSAPTVSTTIRWSDRAAWPSGRLPAEGEPVTIPAGTSMVLDVSPPRLASLTIEGTLIFDDSANRELSADSIMVHGGTLRVGSPERPFTKRASIVLTNVRSGEDVMGMGDRVLGVMGGGTLDLHGEPRLPWTRLSASVKAGATTITLADAPNWRPGDRLVVSSTDFDHKQAEVVEVLNVTGSTVTLKAPLKNDHFGEVQTIAGRRVDERAEVGLLTRNVTVRADETSVTDGFGGQIMVMDTSVARLSGTELTRMGQKGLLRRYPIHFHMQGPSRGSYVKGSSLHGLFNRCVTLHGTNLVTLDANVMYDTLGHCVFMEDGAETGNVLTGNLVLGTRNAEEGKALLPSDRGGPGASSFWITNPDNTVRGNVAGGGDGVGFWYALPVNPTGLSKSTTMWPRRTPLREFRDNVAHSYGGRGLNVDNAPKDDTGTLEAAWYEPKQNPNDEKSEAVTATFENFTGYKIRDHGVWLRGKGHVVRNAVLADNAIGATFASSATVLQGGLVVGESANLGRPQSWEKRGVDGRSLPKPWEESFPIRGFEFYDGNVRAEGVTFANFMPNSQRQGSALAYLRRNSFPLSPRNGASNLTFVNANRVFLENPLADRDGDKAAVFRDEDGSVTGQAGKFVVANSSLLLDAGCVNRAEWNAFVCDLPYGRLWADNVARSGGGTLTVSRGGASTSLVGVPDGRTYASTTVPVRQSYTLSYQNGVPSRVRIGMADRAPGAWIRLSLPYASEPSIYRDWWIDNRNKLKKVALGSLDSTSGDSYAFENGVLHLKLVVKSNLDWATVDVCTTDLCK